MTERKFKYVITDTSLHQKMEYGNLTDAFEIIKLLMPSKIIIEAVEI